MAGLAVALVAAAALLLPLVTRATPTVRDRALDALRDRFLADVRLDTLEVAVFPSAGIAGTGLALHWTGDREPLVEIPSFSATAGLLDLWARPLRLRTVELSGLAINIPSGRKRDRIEAPDFEGGANLVVDRLSSRSATLEISPADPAKRPRRFDIHDLEMWDVGRTHGARFRASLTNPVPKGSIVTEGVFGPWQSDAPGATPVRGTYRFEEANLDTIRGIGGLLSSTGAYEGVLERIAVSGQTETADFSVDVGGRPMPLQTKFEAVVDGTSGDTWLERVDASLGRTPLHVRGAIVGAREESGRHIALDVTIANGFLEDVLALAVDSEEPPMTGRMSLEAKLRIPAGDRAVADRLHADGRFELAQARFSSFDVQRRVDALSRRGRGDLRKDGPSVVSQLRGQFRLEDGTITFSQLTFGVPGATVRLAGTYGLRSQAIDMKGELLLDASLRQTTAGWRSALAMLAQPLFRRPGGGSSLPIRVSGSRTKPSFGLDIRRALLPG